MKSFEWSSIELKGNNNSHIVIKGNYTDIDKRFIVNIIRDMQYVSQNLSDRLVILNFNGTHYSISVDVESGQFDNLNTFDYRDYNIPRGVYCIMCGLISTE
jgi:hypothetical protein